MLYAARVLVKAASDLISDKEVLMRVKEEHLKNTSGKSYKCALPGSLSLQSPHYENRTI